MLAKFCVIIAIAAALTSITSTFDEPHKKPIPQIHLTTSDTTSSSPYDTSSAKDYISFSIPSD